MNTPNHASDSQIAALVEGRPTSMKAGADFPTLRVHPTTPVGKLAKNLALVGLSIYTDTDTGQLVLIETWRLEAMRNPRPVPTPEQIKEINERSAS